MNSYFDKIYCINLDKREDRWIECQKEFDKNNIIVQRLSAIDGKSLNQIPTLLPGQIGCLASQLSAIVLAKQYKFSSVVIIEDDVEFCDNFQNELKEHMEMVPDDWQMLYFGANHIQHPTKINDKVYKLNYSYSAHCYAIRNNMFDFLINILSETKDPLDVVYANIQRSINAYVFNPHLVWQKPGYSDICEEYVDYTHVHKIRL